MTKHLIPLLFFMQFLLLSRLQGQVTVFNTLISDESLSPSTLAYTPDGNILLLGKAEFSTTNADILLSLLATDGTPLWTKRIGGSGFETPRGLIRLNAGGYLIVGNTTSGSFGGDDILLVKIDETGAVLWSKTYGGSREDRGFSVLERSNGNIMIAGTTVSFGSGERDAFLLQTDANGTLLWSKTYGGVGNDNFFNIQPSGNDAFVLTGPTFSFGQGQHDIWATEVDEQGNINWIHLYGTSADEHSRIIRPTPDNGWLILGHQTPGTPAQRNGVLLKINEQGNLQWTRSFGGNTEELMGNFILSQDQSQVLISGHTRSGGPGDKNIFLLDLDLQGNFQEAFTFGESGDDELLFGSQQTLLELPGGGLLLSGELERNGKDELALLLLGNTPSDNCSVEDWTPNVSSINVSQNGVNPAVSLQPNTRVADISLVNEDYELVSRTLCLVPPLADFTIPDSLCVGDCVTPIDNSSGMPENWQWTFENADPMSSVAQEPGAVCFDTEGTYAIKLVVSNQAGVDSLTREIVVTSTGSVCPESPEAQFTIPAGICAGECIDLVENSSGNPDTWTWTFEGAEIPASTDPEPQDVCFPNPGTFSIRLVVENELGTDTSIQILNVLPVPTVDLGPDVELCPEDSLLLTPILPQGFSFSWNDGFPEIERVIRSPGTYQLEVFNDLCSAEDDVTVETLFCETCNVYIPNVFSPNEDGVNDRFSPYLSCPPLEYHLRIFDRWGNLVCAIGGDPDRGWDGFWRGKPAVIAVYVYLLEVKWEEGDNIVEKVYTGDVTLVR